MGPAVAYGKTAKGSSTASAHGSESGISASPAVGASELALELAG
jgi:hypothetical protein